MNLLSLSYSDSLSVNLYNCYKKFKFFYSLDVAEKADFAFLVFEISCVCVITCFKTFRLPILTVHGIFKILLITGLMKYLKLKEIPKT